MLMAVAAALGVSVGASGWLGRSAERRDEAPGIYHYRFERTTRGSIMQAVDQEIAFHQERANRDPRGGLDLAALAPVRGAARMRRKVRTAASLSMLRLLSVLASAFPYDAVLRLFPSTPLCRSSTTACY